MAKVYSLVGTLVILSWNLLLRLALEWNYIIWGRENKVKISLGLSCNRVMAVVFRGWEALGSVPVDA